MVRVSFLLICLLVAGCGKSKRQCASEAADLGETLSKMDSSLGVPTQYVKLVLRTDLPLPREDDFGWVLELSGEGTRVRSFVDTPGPARAGVKAIVDRARKFGEDPRYLLAIDAATPWSMVVELLEALKAAQARSVTLVFARPPTGQTLPRTAIDDRLDATLREPPNERAPRLAELTLELVRDCKAVERLFGSTGSTDESMSRAKRMITGLPPALIECNCKCDVAALKSVMWRILANQDPTTTLTLSLEGETLELPKETTWELASKRLEPGRTGLLARVAP